ncbi:MAG: DUF4936 family protein [Janthinobacterium lividum]
MTLETPAADGVPVHTMEHYIYYQVSAVHSAALEQTVLAMQQRLRASLQVDTGLKRRPGHDGGAWTYMEVYLGVPAGFEAVLAQAVQEAGVLPLTLGTRHVELFEEIVPCA